MRSLLLLFCCLALARNAVSDDLGLDPLMRTLAQNTSGRATFREKKFIAMLDRPVESSGELIYVAPDHLEKNTLQPKPEFLIIDHGTLSIKQNGQQHILQLNDYPEVAAFIDSIRGTLAGDRKALEQVYRLFLGGSSKHWTLLLQPTDPEMAATISRIKIVGNLDQVRFVEITQADGDRSEMTIEPSKAKQ
jgi:hypothetical protein